MDWSSKNVLVWQQADANDVQQIWTANPNGSNLTCLSLLPGWPSLSQQKLSPRFSPDGNHIVFSYEQPVHSFALPSSIQNGYFNNLAVCNADGSGFTTVVTPNSTYVAPFGATFPIWNNAGTTLAWAEILAIPPANSGGIGGQWWGSWRIRTAGITFPGGVPTVGTAVTMGTASAHFQYPNDLSSDGSLMLYVSDNAGATLDIWTYNVSSRVNTNVTSSPNNWDEHPAFLPGSNSRFAWMSSRPFPGWLGSQLTLAQAVTTLRTEFCTMDLAGTNFVQTSHYSTPGGGHREYQLGARIVSSEIRFSPDGTQALIQCLIPSSHKCLYGILTLATGAWLVLPTSQTTGYPQPVRGRRR